MGYSRIYLGQHFLEDVILGIVIGVSTSLLIIGIVLKVKKTSSQQYFSKYWVLPNILPQKTLDFDSSSFNSIYFSSFVGGTNKLFLYSLNGFLNF